MTTSNKTKQTKAMSITKRFFSPIIYFSIDGDIRHFIRTLRERLTNEPKILYCSFSKYYTIDF